MVKLIEIPPPEVVRAYKGQIDFYVQNGQALARKWPSSPNLGRAPGSRHGQDLLKASAANWRGCHSSMKRVYNQAAQGSGCNGKDLFTACFYGTYGLLQRHRRGIFIPWSGGVREQYHPYLVPTRIRVMAFKKARALIVSWDDFNLPPGMASSHFANALISSTPGPIPWRGRNKIVRGRQVGAYPVPVPTPFDSVAASSWLHVSNRLYNLLSVNYKYFVKKAPASGYVWFSNAIRDTNHPSYSCSCLMHFQCFPEYNPDHTQYWDDCVTGVNMETAMQLWVW